MTEIIIDHNNTSFLIKRLKEIFNPYIITEVNETVLNFNNDLGKGTFIIITLDENKLNIHFKGKLSKNTDIKFYNSKQPAINFFYLQEGHVSVNHNYETHSLEKDSVQQLVYSSDKNDVETIFWPKNVDVEFNFLKLFDVSYLNSASDALGIEAFMKKEDTNVYVKALKSDAIDSNKPLLYSEKVAEQRIKELEKSIRNLFEIQKDEVLKQL